MLKLNEIKLPINYSELDIINSISQTIRVKPSQIVGYKILRKSLDSRRKDNIKYVLNLQVELREEKSFVNRNPKLKDNIINSNNLTLQELVSQSNIKLINYRPVVIGAGPAGLFCALTLAYAGLRPIVIERGQRAVQRKHAVEVFCAGGKLDVDSNIQFGEGGAGTFSDGKLNTGVGGEKIRMVLQEFVQMGANADILYDSKPHIGTDILIDVVSKFTDKIQSLGGEVMFDTKLIDIDVNNGEIFAVKVMTKQGQAIDIATKKCVIAIGHSSRDTFQMLSKKIIMQAKPFAIGVRVEHLQEMIDKSQYGSYAGKLPPADYKLACHLDNGRSCFSFCMCPGGYVVPASSELGGVVTNGMSNNAREGANANSALLVNVTPEDFGDNGVLAGVEFQRKYEQLAFALGGNDYKAPIQKYADFSRKKATSSFGEVLPTYSRGVQMSNLWDCLPNYVASSIDSAIKIFDNKLKGFASGYTLMTGVETRSSSPIKMLRDNQGNSSIGGLMPCGEGAGYAGGITSASIDGINQALNLINNL